MANKEKGQKYTLTRQQKEDLEKELRYLKIYTRKTVAEKIRQARLLGNLSNNTAFDAARNEQRTTEARINEIESILLNHEIIDYDIPLETVVVGCRVRVNDLEFNEELLFSIVTTDEANSLKNKLSDQSPLGKSLIGKSIGDTISISTSTGSVSYKILEIIGTNGIHQPTKSKKDTNISSGTISKNSMNQPAIRDITPQNFITRVNVYHCINKKTQSN